MFDINKATMEQLYEMRGDLWKQQAILTNNLSAVEQEIQARKPKLSPPAEQPKERHGRRTEKNTEVL
jgi:hypothetical protein